MLHQKKNNTIIILFYTAPVNFAPPTINSGHLPNLKHKKSSISVTIVVLNEIKFYFILEDMINIINDIHRYYIIDIFFFFSVKTINSFTNSFNTRNIVFYHTGNDNILIYFIIYIFFFVYFL